jgi:hypothetical protein
MDERIHPSGPWVAELDVKQSMSPIGARLRVVDKRPVLRVLCVSIAWLACTVAHAHADTGESGTERAIVFAPAKGSAHKGDAGVVRDVRAAIERLELATLLPEPPLDLEAMQMTIDCVGESADCLRQVAERSKARFVIAPSVEHAKSGSTLRILYFDANAHAEPRTALRRAPGKELDHKTLEAIPDMLHDLFATAAKPGPEPEPEPAADSDDDATEPAATEPPVQPQPAEPAAPSKLPLGPILLGAGGVAVIASGVVMGAVMQSTQDHYAKRSVQTVQQAKQADDERKAGQQQALVANVLIGVGALAVVASGIWFLVGLNQNQERPPQTALVPVISARSAGLSLVGTWEDRP